MSQDTLDLLWTADDDEFFQDAYAFIQHTVEQQVCALGTVAQLPQPDYTVLATAVTRTALSIGSQIKWLKEDLERAGGAYTRVAKQRIRDLWDTTMDLATLSKNKAFLVEFEWEIGSECNELQYRILNLKHAG